MKIEERWPDKKAGWCVSMSGEASFCLDFFSSFFVSRQKRTKRIKSYALYWLTHFGWYFCSTNNIHKCNCSIIFIYTRQMMRRSRTLSCGAFDSYILYHGLKPVATNITPLRGGHNCSIISSLLLWRGDGVRSKQILQIFSLVLNQWPGPNPNTEYITKRKKKKNHGIPQSDQLGQATNDQRHYCTTYNTST
jgi:hypothetical protein